MACPPIITGDRFLERTLTHLDCQAQTLGSWGYQSLGGPGSTAGIAMAALLTVFVALFGIRLMFGPGPGARDIVFDVAKIGIVLTLAFSWPAYKVLVYDLVLYAPTEIASAIAAPEDRNGTGFVSRLQATDNAIVTLTEIGTGRNTGSFVDDSAPGATFQASAMRDENAFGWSRLVWLAGTIGILGLMRIAAGLLLAIAPLMAGLLLFEATRGLFAGWLRGLALVLIGSLGAGVVLAAELAVLQPWLADALRLRQLGYATPAAPIELFAMTLAFALVQFGMLWLLAKVAFARGWISLPDLSQIAAHIRRDERQPAIAGNDTIIVSPNRAEQIADGLAYRIEHERGGYRRHPSILAGSVPSPQGDVGASSEAPVARPRLGQTHRRTALRKGGASRRRESNV